MASLAGKTLTDMTGNANFPEPEPDLETYADAVNDYRTKHEAAVETGGKFDRTAKDIAKLVLLQAMKRLSSYVNFTANGNENKLVSSGFQLAQQPTPNDVPFVPLWIRVRKGSRKGQLKLDTAPVKWAWFFEYQISHLKDANGEIVWGDTVYDTTKTRGTLISGLLNVVTYWVRVRARNGYGAGDWSDPVSASTD